MFCKDNWSIYCICRREAIFFFLQILKIKLNIIYEPQKTTNPLRALGVYTVLSPPKHKRCRAACKVKAHTTHTTNTLKTQNHLIPKSCFLGNQLFGRVAARARDYLARTSIGLSCATLGLTIHAGSPLAHTSQHHSQHHHKLTQADFV